MDIRNEEETSREKELNFRYKELTEEENFIDNVMTEENKKVSDKKTNEHKITKEDIINSVMEQVKKVKRDDKTQEPSNMDKWFSEYQKQPITINKERVQTYLENYEDLEKLIKFREDKLVSGEVKPESKTLEINNISNLKNLVKRIEACQTFSFIFLINCLISSNDCFAPAAPKTNKNSFGS